MDTIRTAVCALTAVLGFAPMVSAQGPAPAVGDWKITAYPILVWLPLDIGIDVEVPPGDGSEGGSGDILDGRVDGAFLGGLSANNGKWAIETQAIWAGVGGDRVELPKLVVDADIVYAYGTVGRAVARDLYVTAGVRRLALGYDITINDQPQFTRKPGVWDPLIGIGYHRVRNTLELHAVFEGGGFGVGADVDIGAGVRLDWKPIPHVGLTVGYNAIYFELTHTETERDFTVKQTLNGPIVGIGLYF
jgi:hypothetical protein